MAASHNKQRQLTLLSSRNCFERYVDTVRALRDKEKPLVHILFQAAGIEVTEGVRAEPMADGSMGSLLFERDLRVSHFGVAERYFLDEDGVLVSATLNTDADGRPVELDVWKVDFSPLKRWPDVDDILEKPPNNALQTDAAPRRR